MKGWEKHGHHERPNTFWKYFVLYPLNWTWTLGSLLFMAIFIEGANKYKSPALWTMTLFPLTMLLYNFVDEYYAFKWYITGHRNISARSLQSIAKWICTIILIYLIVRIFIIP